MTRHSGVAAVLRHFEYDHLRPDLREYAQQVWELAHWMVDNLIDDPQLTMGLHDLLRAKDCFIRAALATKERIN